MTYSYITGDGVKHDNNAILKAIKRNFNVIFS
jgi:hypothetical protein